jgi:hypothetical protein
MTTTMSRPTGGAPGRAQRAWARTAVVVAAGLALAGVAGVASADPVASPARTWSVNGQVLSILPVGDRVYVGGTFTAVVDTSGISYPVSNLAVFDRSTGAADLSFDADPSGTVTTLATDGSNLYIGGAFNTISNAGISYPRNNIAAVDATTGLLSSWHPTVIGGQVDTIAYSAATGSVYLGGPFTSVKDVSNTYSLTPYIAEVSASTGLVDVGFAPAPNGPAPSGGRVRSINVAADGSGRLYIGGDFTSVAGLPNTKSIARIDGSTGAVDTTFQPAPTNQTAYSPVFDITSDSNRVYVGAGGSGGACTALTATTGAAVWSHHANGNLQSVRLIGSTLYCGGHFSGTASFDGLNRNKIAAVDASTGAILPFAPNVNTSLGVWSMGSQPGDPTLYIGGDFTKVAGVSQQHFAMFPDQADQTAPEAPRSLVAQAGDGTVWLSWLNPSSDGGSPIARFKIYRSTTPGGENLAGTSLATVKWSASSASYLYQDSTVTNGTTYYYEVVAVNGVGTGPASNEDSNTPGTSIVVSPPSAPVSFLVTNPPGSMKLTWNPPLDNGGAPPTSYNVYRSTSPGGEGNVPYASGITTNTFSDLYNLVAGTTYYYRISAVNAAGEGELSYETSAVEQPGPPGPPELSATVSGGVVHLSWTVPPDGGSPITKYVLTRNTVRLKNLTASVTATDDTAVTSGTQYTYQVKAINAYGNGQLSNKVTVTVP